MVNYKTHLTIIHKGDKYELDGGQNKSNSADYIYMLYKDNDFLTTVGYETIKTGKIQFETMDLVPEIVVKKIKKYLNQ